MSLFKRMSVIVLSLLLLVGVVACSEEISTTTTTTASTTESTTTTTTAIVSTTDPNLPILMEVADTITIANADNITENFNLFSEYGVIDITWTSNNDDVITIASSSITVGSSEVFPVTITPMEEDTVVELEATFILNSVEYSKTYYITVKAIVDDGIYRSVSTLYDEAAIDDLVVFNGYVSVVYKVGYTIMDNNGDSLIVYTTTDYANLVKVGDNVTVSGTYSQYNSLYQITTLTSQVINSSNNAVTITPVVLENASDLLEVDSSVKLNHGIVYTVTVTPVLNASNNIELFDGSTKVAVVYYNSLAASITALQGFVGREVTIDVLYYALHTTDGIRVLFYGTEEDIEAAPLTLEQKFAVDTDLIDNPLELTDSLVLPDLEYSTVESVIISSELTNYVSLNSDVFTITRPTSLEGDAVGTLTVRIMIGEEFRDVVINVTVKAVVGASATDLIISEYIEGSDYNKYVEIYNGTASSINLSTYTLELYVNGGTTASKTLTLTGTIASGDVIVIYNNRSAVIIYTSESTDILSNDVMNFNGDDAIVLKNNGTVIDSIGKIGQDPGDFWGDTVVSTKDMTLVRKSYIISGDTDPYDDYNPNLEWTAYPKDDATHLGSHVTD